MSVSDFTKIKILVGYHKPAMLLNNAILTPIHLGRALVNTLSKDGIADQDEQDWMTKNLLGDNTGDNISLKNRFYNEMSGIYWAWKNQKKLDNPEYIGFFHYRRQFVFGDVAEVQYKNNYAPGAYDSQFLSNGLTGSDVENFFNEKNITKEVIDYEVIVPKKVTYEQTVYQHYAKYHDIKDLNVALQIIKKLTPEYYESAQIYMQQKGHYLWNMFIMKQPIFNIYCEWIFKILGELEKLINFDNKTIIEQRVLGFLSERLTGIFITHLYEIDKYKIKEKFSVFEENTNSTSVVRPYFNDIKKSYIPVVFSCDHNYAKYLCVMINSIIVNSSAQNNYEIFVLEDSISNEDKRLLQLAIYKYSNFKLTFVAIEPYTRHIDVKNFPLNSHFTLATYYRFFIPRIFASFEKILYLDCDMVALCDVADIFHSDLEGNMLLACRDIEVIRLCFSPEYNNKYSDYLSKVLKIHNPFNYIQAGMLLVNVRKMIETDFEEKCLAKLIELQQPWFVDQDVINSLVEGDVKFADSELNVEWHIAFNNKNIESVLPASLCQSYFHALNSPRIIHYCSIYKPWKNPEFPLAFYFWKYARDTPFYEIILNANLKSNNKINSEKIYKLNKYYYLKYLILSKLTLGKRRKRYKQKTKSYKELL